MAGKKDVPGLHVMTAMGTSTQSGLTSNPLKVASVIFSGGGGEEGNQGSSSAAAKPHKVGLFGRLCGPVVFIEGSSSLFCPFSYCTGPDQGADGTTKQPLLSVM